MSWSPLDHTADVGLVLEAADAEALFADAVAGMTDVVTPLAGVACRAVRTIEVTAPALDLLLVELLDELLYRFETEGWLTRRASVRIDRQGAGFRARVGARGERRELGRHPVKVLLKAVTLHRLEVARDPAGRWRGCVVFDI